MTEDIKQVEVGDQIDRIVPKFCTSINIAVLNNKSIILTLLYTEGDFVAIIDRIVIDSDHVASLYNTLGNILREENEDEPSARDK